MNNHHFIDIDLNDLANPAHAEERYHKLQLIDCQQEQNYLPMLSKIAKHDSCSKNRIYSLVIIEDIGVSESSVMATIIELLTDTEQKIAVIAARIIQEATKSFPLVVANSIVVLLDCLENTDLVIANRVIESLATVRSSKINGFDSIDLQSLLQNSDPRFELYNLLLLYLQSHECLRVQNHPRWNSNLVQRVKQAVMLSNVAKHYQSIAISDQGLRACFSWSLMQYVMPRQMQTEDPASIEAFLAVLLEATDCIYRNLPVVHSFCTSEVLQFQMQSILIVGKHRFKPAFVTLLRLLDSTDERVRGRAWGALANFVESTDDLPL